MSAEDVILQKLAWYLRGGGVSERQLRDVVGVFRVQVSELDQGYLEEMASDSGLSDILKRVRAMEG